MTEIVFTPLHPKIILAVVAHPDDIEFGMGGTIAKYVAGGATAYYYVLTTGNKGSDDRTAQPDVLRDIRREEQRAAAKLLGVSNVFFADYEDGELEVNLAVKRDIVRVVRQTKPDVVLTMDPTMVYSPGTGFINHPDHRAAGQATLDAVYPLARDHLSFPELLNDEQLEPHKVATVLMVNFERQNFFVDISAHMETKLQALSAHASQLKDSEATFARLRQHASQTAARLGAKYAESFVRVDIAA